MASQRKSHVFRVTGLSKERPDGDLKTSLQEALNDNFTDEEIPQIKAEITIVPSCYESDAQRVALVQFRGGVPQFLHELRVNPLGDWQIEMGDNDINFDCHFFGFTQLYAPGENKPVVADIIGIAGLDGHAYGSWQGRGNLGRMWLRDFLSKDLPQCRTMIYGYNSKLSSHGVDTILDYGRELMEEIKKIRNTKELQQRPLIFIVHSFGGIILAHCLVRAVQTMDNDHPAISSLYRATYGMILFAIPHKGLVVDDIQQMLAGDKSHPREQLLEQISSKSDLLIHQLADFKNLIRDRKVVSFYETEQTRRLVLDPESGRWKRTGEFMTTVGADSALLHLPDHVEDKVPLHSDHSMLVKFDTSNAAGYRTALDKLRQFSKDASSVVAARFGLSLQDNPTQVNRGGDVCMINNMLYGYHCPPIHSHELRKEGVDIDQIHVLLPPNPVGYYIPRPELNEKIKKQLYPPSVNRITRVLPIRGLGGAGKSQLVLNYIKEFGSVYRRCFWFEASDPRRIEHGYRRLYETLNPDVAGHIPVERVLEGVRSWFGSQKHDRLLVVFDGTDIITDEDHEKFVNLGEFFPQNPRVDVIITSRNFDITRLSRLETIEVGEMHAKEAIALFLQSAGLNSTAEMNKKALDITKTLGYLALAISLAGIWVSKRPDLQRDLLHYLREYDRQRKQVLERSPQRLIDSYEESVMTTWESSFEVLKRSPQELLVFLGFFHFEDLDPDLLYTPQSPQDKAFCWSEVIESDSVLDMFQIKLFLEDIHQFYLIQIRPRQEAYGMHQTTATYAMHPLVHAWAYDRLSAEKQRHLSLAALHMLKETIGKPNLSSTDKFRLVPHIMSNFDKVSRSWGSHDEEILDVFEYLNAVSLLLRDRFSLLHEALKVHDFVLGKGLQGHDRNNRCVLRAKSEKALTLRYLARFQEARDLLEEVLPLQSKHLGDGDSDTLDTVAYISVVFRDLGNYKKAEEFLDWGLPIAKETFGDGHPKVHYAKIMLGRVMSYRGMHASAERLLNVEFELLRNDQLKLPEELKFIALNNLGFILRLRGKFTEAKHIIEATLRQREQASSNKHAETLMCKGNLGLALLGQGKYDEANVLFEEVHRLRLQIFGEKHTDTQLSQNCIAALRFAQGQYRESEELARASFRSRQEILTERHPETLESHANIAVALLYQGRTLEAEGILQEILQDEPSFWLVPLWKAYLAMALRRQKKNDKARELLGDFLCKTPEGDHEHPHILLCQRELASVLRDLRDYSKSGKLYETVLRSQKRVLGKAHADTLTTQYEIAGSFKAQVQYYEAEKMYSKVMKKRTQSLGEKHPDTMLCKGELDSLGVLA